MLFRSIKNFADILFCNEDEIKSLYECDLESAKHKVEEMGKETVITLGSNGSTVFRNNEWTNVEAYKPKAVIDTTGAGDLFAAGYLHGYLNNLSQQECLEKGNELSAKIIQQIGARFYFFFLLKLPFPFFGLTTLDLYFLVNRSFAIKFFFLTNLIAMFGTINKVIVSEG